MNHFDHFDYDIIVSIIENYILFEVIEYAWVCVYAKACNMIISIFDIELVCEVSSSKFQNSFSEIIQFFMKIILLIEELNILYI